jgi:hypothetical protein
MSNCQYYININQKAAKEFNDKYNQSLDFIDLAIVSYIYRQKNTKFAKINSIKIDDKRFFRVSYQNILLQLPLMQIKTREGVAGRIKKLEDAGVFEKYVKDRLAYVCLSERFEELIFSKQESSQDGYDDFDEEDCKNEEKKDIIDTSSHEAREFFEYYKNKSIEIESTNYGIESKAISKFQSMEVQKKISIFTKQELLQKIDSYFEYLSLKKKIDGFAEEPVAFNNWLEKDYFNEDCNVKVNLLTKKAENKTKESITIEEAVKIKKKKAETELDTLMEAKETAIDTTKADIYKKIKDVFLQYADKDAKYTITSNQQHFDVATQEGKLFVYTNNGDALKILKQSKNWFKVYCDIIWKDKNVDVVICSVLKKEDSLFLIYKQIKEDKKEEFAKIQSQYLGYQKLSFINDLEEEKKRNFFKSVSNYIKYQNATHSCFFSENDCNVFEKIWIKKDSHESLRNIVNTSVNKLIYLINEVFANEDSLKRIKNNQDKQNSFIDEFVKKTTDIVSIGTYALNVDI